MKWERYTQAVVFGALRCGIDARISVGSRDLTQEFLVKWFDDETQEVAFLTDKRERPLRWADRPQGAPPGELVMLTHEIPLDGEHLMIRHVPGAVLSFEDPTP